MENPRFTAIRFREKERVMFPFLAYLVTATELAGRNASLTVLCKNMMKANPTSDLNNGIIQKNGTPSSKLKDCTLNSPILSVIIPPNQEPTTEPIPKKLKTNPA